MSRMLGGGHFQDSFQRNRSGHRAFSAMSAFTKSPMHSAMMGGAHMHNSMMHSTMMGEAHMHNSIMHSAMMGAMMGMAHMHAGMMAAHSLSSMLAQRTKHDSPIRFNGRHNIKWSPSTKRSQIQHINMGAIKDNSAVLNHPLHAKFPKANLGTLHLYSKWEAEDKAMLAMSEESKMNPRKTVSQASIPHHELDEPAEAPPVIHLHDKPHPPSVADID